jgi:hypothetical protein
VEGPIWRLKGIQGRFFTVSTGQKKVLETCNLFTEPARGCHLFQTGASLIVRSSSDAGETPPSSLGRRFCLGHILLWVLGQVLNCALWRLCDGIFSTVIFRKNFTDTKVALSLHTNRVLDAPCMHPAFDVGSNQIPDQSLGEEPGVRHRSSLEKN